VIEPLGDRIVVRVDEDQDTVTPAGIIIPEQAREKPQRGTVLAVGPGLNHPMPGGGVTVTPVGAKEGDRVLFSKYAGTEVQTDDGEVLILREGDVLGIER
jgi:chaperonin GroES